MPDSSKSQLRLGEAAKLLGVSTRTLERYTTAKRIRVKFAEGVRHPVRIYERADVLALKRELAAAKADRQPDVRSPDAMQRIGFRLEPVDMERLTRLAARERVSPGDLGRHLLIQALHDTGGLEIKAAISDIQLQLRELHEAMESKERQLQTVQTALAESTRATDQLRADMANVLCMLVGQLTDAKPDQVRAWVREGLHSRAR